MKHWRSKILAAGLAGLMLTGCPAQAKSDEKMTVTFLDVGQASAAVLKSGDHVIVIDGGNRDDSDRMYSFLKQQNADTIDLLIGTHAHEDHIGGLAGALNEAPADTVLCPVTSCDSKTFSSFRKYAQTRSSGLTVPKPGDVYSAGDMKVTVLGLNAGDSVNDSSLILRVDYGKTSLLFSGDAERAGEQAVLNSRYASRLKADVYAVGHHGSGTSTSYPFLYETDPDYAVISCGKNNQYGFPDESVTSRLKDADVKVLRTDLQGDITCTSDKTTMACTPEKNPDADVFRPGFASSDPDAGSSSASASSPAIPAETPQAAAPAAETAYVLNTSTKKFHRPECASVKKMKAKNREDVQETREEIIAQGYEPCKNCNP